VTDLSHHDLVSLLVLLTAGAAMLVLVPKLRIPYPILLVLGGLGLGFVPGLPEIDLPVVVVRGHLQRAVVREREGDVLSLQLVAGSSLAHRRPDLEEHPFLTDARVRQLVAERDVALVVVRDADEPVFERHDLRHAWIRDLDLGFLRVLDRADRRRGAEDQTHD
jgi:hypothetical protein